MKRKSDSPSELPPEPLLLEIPPEITVEAPVEAAPVEMPSADLREPIRTAPPQPPRPGMFAPLLGGALAAIAGFGLSHFDAFGLRTDTQVDVSRLEVRQAEALTALKADQTSGLTAIGTRLDDLSQRLAKAETAIATATDTTFDPVQLEALDNRLKTIEALPPGSDASTAALAATLADVQRQVQALGAAEAVPSDLSAKVDAALAQLAEAEAAATARADEAAAVAEATRQRNALADLRAAVDSGAPFDVQLAAVTDADLQTALAGAAAAGVTPLTALQSSFPEAARQSLALARASSSADGWGARLVDFLGAQTGARSVTPREGSDPDAVLSRAEAALTAGRPADALTEIATLDPAIAAPLANWSAAATLRIQAEQALDAAVARLPRLED
jgi:hypothetical protein